MKRLLVYKNHNSLRMHLSFLTDLSKSKIIIIYTIAWSTMCAVTFWLCNFCHNYWNIWRPSFPLKFTQLSILPRSVKWVPACMDCLEAAAICGCIFFQSAGGNLIIVKCLWDLVIRALYKCTTLLFTFTISHSSYFWNSMGETGEALQIFSLG